MESAMNNLYENLEKILNENISKIIISNPLKHSKYKKIVVENKANKYMISKYTDTQVFNDNLTVQQVKTFVFETMNDFKQANFWTLEWEYMLKISKKNKVFITKSPSKLKPKLSLNHNREKNYILSEQTVVPPLVDMGIFSQEGKIIKSMHFKFKQINRILELIDDIVSKKDLKEINIVDFGCGKSYLTFIIYHYFTYIKHIKANVVGLDLKKDVIENCNKTAQKYGYENLKFYVGDIKDYQPEFQIDMVITLHACDTATDYALFNAIKWGAKMIFSVPCCQHELNEKLKSTSLPIINRYGIAKERFSALFTDIIRCNLLEYFSYKTDLLEFVDFDATPKNLLIRASLSFIPQNVKTKMLKEVEDVLKEFNITQKLYELLIKN